MMVGDPKMRNFIQSFQISGNAQPTDNITLDVHILTNTKISPAATVYIRLY